MVVGAAVLDERVGRQIPFLGVLQEPVGGEKVPGEAVAQPGGVDDARERNRGRRVAVDTPGKALGFEALEERLGGVVNREGIRGGQVDDVPGRGRGVEKRAISERLRRYLAEPVIEGCETTSERGSDRQLLGRVAS